MNLKARETRAAFIAVTVLFLAWGFITALIDPLIPAVRAIFHLSYTESMLTQFAFFMAYGVMSLPGAALIARSGYVGGIAAALATMLAGCLLMLLATQLAVYALVLAALFILASGITVLQVAANPLAAALGSAPHAHFRLTLSQAFNSFGTVVAPYIGSLLMLRGGIFTGDGADSVLLRTQALASIRRSFGLVAACIALLLLLVLAARRRVAIESRYEAVRILPALRSPFARLGAMAIFLYVGAEVSIGSIMINYLHQPAVLDVSIERAGELLSLYWLGAMIGRFGGSLILTRVAAARVVMAASAAAAILCLVVCLTDGWIGAVAAIAVGLFNSVMFPTIFTLTLERSRAGSAATSGLLCTAIVGGALLPPLVGWVADHSQLSSAFVVPALAYFLITAFAVRARTTPRVEGEPPAVPGADLHGSLGQGAARG